MTSPTTGLGNAQRRALFMACERHWGCPCAYSVAASLVKRGYFKFVGEVVTSALKTKEGERVSRWRIEVTEEGKALYEALKEEGSLQ